MFIREEIQKFMDDEGYEPMTKEELVLHYDLPISEYRMFFDLLKSMERESIIIQTQKGKYLLTKNSSEYFTGIAQRNSGGFGFVSTENENGEDIYISKQNMKNVMHKDKVFGKHINNKSGNKPEGKILRVLERSKETIVGTFHKEKNYGIVIADDARAYFNIMIPKGKINGAKEEDKVVVEIERFSEGQKKPQGRIIQVIGNKNEMGTDILSIIYQHELPIEFPGAVLKEVQNIDQKVHPGSLKKRTDFSELFTVTMDGAEAKDFDDAISIEREGENIILYVHIADVSHYVKKNSPLDKEALLRGNSVYLLDRVLPMLPEALSNGICSLLPGKIRLTKTVKMTINKGGKVIDAHFYESYIQSDYRLIYKDVSDFLEGKEAVFEDSILKDKIVLMQELSQYLYENRVHRGVIDFDFPETEVIVNEKGEPIEIKQAERRIGNKLIEEFMLIANETVGAYYKKRNAPFIYRIHEKPSEEKAEDFLQILQLFGYHIDLQSLTPKEYQKIIKESKGKKEEKLIHTLLLKSLQKARYSSCPDIHFGLSTDSYCHFTSPIRRYADLFIHRVMHEDLMKNGKFSLRKDDKEISMIADHISRTEMKAELTERAVNDLKKAQYMNNHIGEEFTGIVSSLNNFGFFVEVDNTIEGLVHFKFLSDYYYFDENTWTIRGETNGKVISIGDEIRVRCINVNIEAREIDFNWIEEEKNE